MDRFWDGHQVVVDQPGQHHLGGCSGVFLGDFHQFFVVEKLRPGNWTVGFNLNPFFPAIRQQFTLIEKGVKFNLVNRRDHIGSAQQVFQQINREVADANAAGQTAPLQFNQRLPGFKGALDVGQIWPVDQQQVNILCLTPADFFQRAYALS